MVQSFREIVDQWPTVNDLAADLEEKPSTVRKWKQRNHIPSDRWLELLAHAKRRRIKLDESTLVKLAASKDRPSS